MVGVAVSPNYPADPSVYVSYTFDAYANGTFPRWGTAGQTRRRLPEPAGSHGERLRRVRSSLADHRQPVARCRAPRRVLISGNWCQQYPSHSVDDLMFGADGYLYMSAGDGANSPAAADYGQLGSPANPCGDPANEGGALRTQDILTPGDPTGLSGSVLRLDVSGGGITAAPGNPLVGNGVADDDYVIAMGLRNPFRMTQRPGTNEIWLSDVGWATWEEINVIPSAAAPVEDFGWPCYEGGNGVNVQMGSYSTRAAVPEHLHRQHSRRDRDAAVALRLHALRVGRTRRWLPDGWLVRDGHGLQQQQSLSGVLHQCAVLRRLLAPVRVDHVRRRERRTGSEQHPVPDLERGRTHRGPADGPRRLSLLRRLRRRAHLPHRLLREQRRRRPPAITATPANGPVPLLVQFNGSGSSDPEDGSNLLYAWDLDGDGQFDDSTVVAAELDVHPGRDVYTASLRVTDSGGLHQHHERRRSTPAARRRPSRSRRRRRARPGRSAMSSTSPAQAQDSQGQLLPASALSWDVILHHCYTADNCHTHPVTSYPGVASGSFDAPDHEYPSFLDLRLTANPPPTDWFNTAWTRRLKLTLNNSGQAENADRLPAAGDGERLAAQLRRCAGERGGRPLHGRGRQPAVLRDRELEPGGHLLPVGAGAADRGELQHAATSTCTTATPVPRPARTPRRCGRVTVACGT